MRAFLLVAAAAVLFLATDAFAQERAVKSWYHLRVGDQIETVQATTIEMTHLKDMTEVLVDGRAMEFDGPVALSFAGTGSEPQAYGGSRSGSTSASGDGTHTEVEVVVDFEGNSTTRTTTTRTDKETGETTTTTTTTTTTSDGETTTETTTTTN